MVSSLLEGVGQSLSLLLYSLCGVVPVLFVYFYESFMLESGFRKLSYLYNVDTQARQEIFLPDKEEIKRITYTNTLSNLGNTMFISLCFYPLLVAVYVGRKKRVVFGMICSIVLSYFTQYFGYVKAGISYFRSSIVVYSLIYLWISLKLTLPTDSKIPKHVLGQLLVTMIGTTFFIVMMYVPFGTLMQYLLIFPLWKEVGRFVCMKSAWYLFFDAQTPGSDIAANREAAWVWAGWFQMFFSFFLCLQLTNIEDPTERFLVIGFKNIYEIVLRLTVKERDRKVKEIYSYLSSFCRFNKPRLTRRVTAVISVSDLLQGNERSIVKTNTASKIESHEKAEKAFYSVILVADMIAEYVGIIGSSLIVLLTSAHSLYWPWPVISHVSDPFTNSEEFKRNVIMTCVYQLLGEIVTDTLCIVVESKKLRLPIKTMLEHMRYKNSILLFIFSSWFACNSSMMMVINSQHFRYETCTTTNFCSCDFEEHILWTRYCDYIYTNITKD